MALPHAQKLEQKLHKLMLPDAISIKPQRHMLVSEKLAIQSHHKQFIVPCTTEETSVAVEGSVSVGNQMENADRDSGYVKSVEEVLEQITSVMALESVVTHHELGYTGTFDCIAKFRLVLELSTYYMHSFSLDYNNVLLPF